MTAPDERAFKGAYTGVRHDLLALVPASCCRVLDVGCATGATGGALKAGRPGATVVGIEFDERMGEVARSRLDRVIVGDVSQFEAMRAELGDASFDCILCGDVLEHLVDPWRTLRDLATVCADGGYLVASIPNVGHLDTLVNVLLRRRWPYRDRGIHDASHLRFFALDNVKGLFHQARFEILTIRRNYRIVERPHPRNRFARLIAIPGARSLLTFQFLVLARSASDTMSPPRTWNPAAVP